MKCLHESMANVILEIAVCIPVACMAKPLVTLATVALLAVGTPPFSCLCREVGEGHPFGWWDRSR